MIYAGVASMVFGPSLACIGWGGFRAARKARTDRRVTSGDWYLTNERYLMGK